MQNDAQFERQIGETADSVLKCALSEVKSDQLFYNGLN